MLEEVVESDKLTKNQLKGLILEIATFLALKLLNIQPIPLHNPFNESYSRDYHLFVDLIFFNDGLLYAVECKNLSPKNNYWKNKLWIEDEIVSRFKNLERDTEIDVKVIVTSYYRRAMDILKPEYTILELGHEVDTSNIHESIFSLKRLFLSLITENRQKCNIKHTHGSYKTYYDKLRYIEKILRESFD